MSSFPWLFTHTRPPCTPTCPGIQSEDTLYTRVYSVFVPAIKARTNLCITHSKWGLFSHTSEHAWHVQREDNVHILPTPILWKSEDSAPSHKARTEILTSLCQNVLTLNVKNWFWSSLWMPGIYKGTHIPHTYTHNYGIKFMQWREFFAHPQWSESVLSFKEPNCYPETK